MATVDANLSISHSLTSSAIIELSRNSRIHQFSSMESNSKFQELEKQLELRDSNIASLKRTLEQKEQLLLATQEKLEVLELKKVEFEDALVSLTQECDLDDIDIEITDNVEDTVDTFVSSNSRAAQLESENRDIRIKFATLSTLVQEFCSSTKNKMSSSSFSNVAAAMASALDDTSSDGDVVENKNDDFNFSEAVNRLENSLTLIQHSVPNTENSNSSCNNNSEESHHSQSFENVQLQVKLELEHERRLRIQMALDDSEKRNVVLKREVETKTKHCEDLEKQMNEAQSKFKAKMKQLADENRRLEKLLKVKEAQICESETKAKELSLRAEEFEELFNGQLASVKALQSDLSVASNENKALVKEMEMLNQMFNAMEKHYVNQALTEYKAQENEDYNTNPTDEQGREIVLQDVLNAVSQKENNAIDLEESCFKEVTTKNGTRMVLSVSKTFMKLKDLILEKKTLQDQVEKMKAINAHLCTRVNKHEDKLLNITDELNKTWTFVSTLKHQHRQLHESEQILRAELTEKRHILAKLRKELEYSRESWNVVKKKTADSEREWHSLRAEFAARRKLFKTAYRLGQCGGGGGSESEENGEEGSSSSSAESGFSTDAENANHETETEESNQLNIPSNEDIMTASTTTIKNEPVIVDDEDNDTKEIVAGDESSEDQNNDGEVEVQQGGKDILVIIPPLDFMAQVPPEIMPPLFPPGEDEDLQQYPTDWYQKLMASTARSTVLANRLAEMHRTSGSDNDEDTEGEDEDDYEPQTEEDSVVPDVASPDIVSEIDIVDPIEEELEDDDDDFEDDISEELEDLGLTPEAIEEALRSSGRHLDDTDDEDDEDTTSLSQIDDSEDSEAANELARFQSRSPSSASTSEIPDPPPQPSFSLIPPPATVTVRPTFNYANLDSADNSEDEDNDIDNEEASENATAVTRFLIKHLPKQLAKLRNDKAEMEEKLRDLETVISNQNLSMSEMERRIDVYKKEAETSRKWSFSLANLHQIKASSNTTIGTTITTSGTTSGTTSTSTISDTNEPTIIHDDTTMNIIKLEIVELPVTITKENVTVIWKVWSQIPDTMAFVAYKPNAQGSNDFDYLQSGIALESNHCSEIEVKALQVGLYVLQLKAVK